MNRAEKIKKVNGFGVKSVAFKESDNVTVPELDLIILGYESQDEIAALMDELEKLNATLTENGEALDSTNVKLNAALEEIAELKQERELRESILEELNEQVEELAANKGATHPYPVLTRNGKRFYLTVKSSKVRHNGETKTVTEETLKEDSELFDYLVEKKAAILKPVDEGGSDE